MLVTQVRLQVGLHRPRPLHQRGRQNKALAQLLVTGRWPEGDQQGRQQSPGTAAGDRKVTGGWTAGTAAKPWHSCWHTPPRRLWSRARWPHPLC